MLAATLLALQKRPKATNLRDYISDVFPKHRVTRVRPGNRRSRIAYDAVTTTEVRRENSARQSVRLRS